MKKPKVRPNQYWKDPKTGSICRVVSVREFGDLGTDYSDFSEYALGKKPPQMVTVEYKNKTSSADFTTICRDTVRKLRKDYRKLSKREKRDYVKPQSDGC